MLPRWVLPAITAFILWGVWGVLIKEASRGQDWRAVYVTTNSVIVALVVILAAASRFNGVFIGGKQGVYALMAGLTGTLGYIMVILALQWGGKASVVIPLTQLSPALTVLLAVALLGENLTGRQALGVVLAMISVVLLSTE